MAPVELVLAGAGGRGMYAYGPYALAHPDEVRFVAVAEPDVARREAFARLHGIAAEHCYADWRELFARPQLGAGAVITTQDHEHTGPALAALVAGYDVLLEKPIAPTLAECVGLVQAAERHGRVLQICHVLRYTGFFTTLHEILRQGRLGDLVTVEHRENVAAYHMAHSYVRGNWRRTAESNPMILAKCCHDLDILVWNLARPCLRLSSFGSLLHFRPEHAPPGAPARCTDGCPAEAHCPFSAVAIYLDGVPMPWLTGRDPQAQPPLPIAPPQFPFTAVTRDPSHAGRLAALREGPYGRCVYHCDNDVVDHQVVAMEFAGGVSAVLTMHGHSDEEHRSMRYDGTRATLHGRFGARSALSIHDHRTGAVEQVPLDGAAAGHGGGDAGLMRSFVRVVRGEEDGRSAARAALESHVLGFAAEQARLSGTVVSLDAFRAVAEALV
jgi:predicted dehydrogenase